MSVLGDLEDVGRSDLERVLASKHARMCSARQIARGLEVEYLELLEAASKTPTHGEWARFRLGVYEATKEVMKPRSMFSRAREEALASYPVPPSSTER